MLSQLYKLVVVGLTIFSVANVCAEEAVNTQKQGEFSATFSVLNKYIYRGGVENDDVTLQAGLEYAHKSNFYLGYWGSTLDYNPIHEDKDFGFEHDFYIGYANQLNDHLSYKSQVTAYVYHDAGTIRMEEDHRRSTAFELLNDVTYKDLTLGVAVMLADSSFSNLGDLYFSAAYSYPLPYDFSLNTSIGASVYNDRRDDSIVVTEKQTVWNEARFGVNKALGTTGLDASLEYVWGGKNRLGENLDDQVVFGLNYNY